jgi:DNA-binding CsgD family transcriptional regulator
MTAVMVERDAVMAAVRGLIGDALQGRGGALFVAGEAGLGKTTVLEHAVTSARGRFKVGIGRADVAEAALPFGLINQALEALLDGPAWLTDPADRGSPPAPADYFYAVLARLRRAAAGPLFLALDDAHWADPDSLTLLRLICRRVAAMPVAVLVTARPWPPEAQRAGEELAAQQLAAVQQLTPLSPEAARSILSQRAGAAGPAAGELERATALSAGNPLLLDYVAAALRAGQGLPERQSPGSTSWARRLLLSHLAGLDEPAQRFLRAAAVLGRRFRPEVAAQVAGLAPADAAAAQEALAAAGLGRDAGEGWAEFSHELVRQAVYELAAPGRARLHEAAFRALAARGVNPAEAAGHAVAARLAGDPEALDVLGRAGREALRAGAVGAARRHLQAAVDLAGPAASAELAFDLGRALIAGGDHVAGVAQYEQLLARADLPGQTRLAILTQLSQARLYAGRIAEAEAAMEEAQRLAGPDRRDLAAGAMVDHAAQVMVTYGWKRAAPLALRARELAAEASAPVRAAAAAVWAVGTYFSGDPAGLDVAEAAARSAATAPSWRPAGTPWWDPVAQYASLALSAERFGDARRLLDGILEAAERRSDPMAMAMGLLYRGRLGWRLGQLEEALVLSARLVEAADLVPVLTPVAAADRALVLLDLGRLDEAERWCARADAAAGGGDSLGYTVMLGYLPRGTLALRRGDLESACATFGALWEIADALEVRDPCTVPWAAEAIAAYLACGRQADARRLIDWLAPSAQALPARWPKVVVAAGRAALAEHNGDPETARDRYAEALALQEEMPVPLARAQVLTDYGAYLYRQGDARQARQALAEALRLAESCGAGWHAERARVEWRRAGGRTGTTPPGQLTPQEAAVARLARAGKTNREIAGQLYLTVNTVETHLRHVYQKLGIHRRVELLTLPDVAAEAASGPAPP